MEQACSQQLKHDIIDEIVDRLKPVKWRIPDDFLEYSHFMRCVNSLDWNSSPGYPYMKQFPDNRALFQVVNGTPNFNVCDLMYKKVMDQINNKEADYIRVFIKQEPHTWKKIVQNRYRLIMSVSVVDQLIDQMLFKDLNELMIENHLRIQPKPGWTPLLGGWKIVPKLNVVSTDKSCWDWTMQEWVVEILYQIREKLCLNVTEQWRELAIWRYKKLFSEAQFILSNGLVLQQRFNGMQKSGCVNTIADNSIAQMILDARICLEQGLAPKLMWTMGDDVLQVRQPKEYFDRLGQLCILKQVEPFAEFAGMRFNMDRVEPCYHAKHCYNLLHLNPENDQSVAESYSYLYFNSKYRKLMDTIIQELGEKPPNYKLEEVVNGILIY